MSETETWKLELTGAKLGDPCLVRQVRAGVLKVRRLFVSAAVTSLTGYAATRKLMMDDTPWPVIALIVPTSKPPISVARQPFITAPKSLPKLPPNCSNWQFENYDDDRPCLF